MHVASPGKRHTQAASTSGPEGGDEHPDPGLEMCRERLSHLKLACHAGPGKSPRKPPLRAEARSHHLTGGQHALGAAFRSVPTSVFTSDKSGATHLLRSQGFTRFVFQDPGAAPAPPLGWASPLLVRVALAPSSRPAALSLGTLRLGPLSPCSWVSLNNLGLGPR